MGYQALYRSYRPRTFSEVIDQKAVVQTLTNAIKTDKIGHAYLFCGPRGTGKTTMAKIFATALNCEHGPTSEPCLECETCKSIIKGNNPDVIELDAASNNGADDIRALRDSVKFLPNSCRKKVYIIDEVHMLSQAAFNALLKTLEEPPQYVVFVLATTEPYKIPNTILSRCQRFDFKAITDEGIRTRLDYVCGVENINIESEALDLIVQNAEGGMRDALSVLDQVISFSSDSNITYQDALEVCGNTNSESLLHILSSCNKLESNQAIDLLNTLIREGKEVPKISLDLVSIIRDILLYKNGIKTLNKPFFKNNDNLKVIDSFNNIYLYKVLDILTEAINQMKLSSQKKPYLEVALIKMSDSIINQESVLLNRIIELENKIKDLSKSNKEIEEFSNLNNRYNKPKTPEVVIDDATNEETIVSSEPITLENNKVDVNTSQYVTIDEVNDILNNPDLDTKRALISIQDNLKLTVTNFAVSIFSNGQIAASTTTKFIVVLGDIGFCDRVMKALNYNLILKEINKELPLINSFIAIPQNIYSKIVTDFRNKFKSGITKPILDFIEIPVLKPVFNEIQTKIDPTVEKLKDVFGEYLEIEED